MMLRSLSFVTGVALACATPGLAQEADPQVDLESIDSLLGGDEVSGEQPAPDTPSEAEDAPLPTEDVQPVDPPAEPAAEPDAPVDEPPVEDAPEAPSPGDAPELSDLDRAYVAYSQCAEAAAEDLREAGEAPEVLGVRALLRCADERAAYVNAFYFMLIPGTAGTEEAVVRANAERLAAQTDSFFLAQMTESAATPQESAE